MSQLPIPLVVHVTHEAGVKIGGIGAVLDGLLSSPAYNRGIQRTLLVGPLNVYDWVAMDRLISPANRLQIIYSSVHNVNQAPSALADALSRIEREMNVHLLYGRRAFGDAEHEVILVDAQNIAGNVINSFKYFAWEHWGLPSAQLQSVWEYSFYMNAAEPLFAAIQAVTGDMSPCAERIIIAHEWLGLPVVFSALLHAPGCYRTVFYAHEVATARLLVENNDGHDTRFYNALKQGLAHGNTMDQVFGDQTWYYKHAMIERAGVCDAMFTVGDLVLSELRFLGGAFADASMSLVYNGVSPAAVSLEQKLASRELMLQYAQNLLGYRPDYIFTHVSRMVLSKAFWRDLRVLEHLDGMLAAQGKSAAFFIVATADPQGRLTDDVMRWEQDYGWPMGHRADNGDLRGAEDHFFYHALEPFTWGHHAVRPILVNQFGWSRERCGQRMPAPMNFGDLRRGSDLEFGQSIYEPFGIAQVEPLSAGALCVVSDVCGCVGFVNQAVKAAWPDEETPAFPNFVVADYTTLPSNWMVWSAWDALWIDRAVRDGIEASNGYRVAQQIMERLPCNTDDMARLLAAGQRVAAHMSWDVVTTDYLLPALHQILNRAL
jgi:hypothetical protein